MSEQHEPCDEFTAAQSELETQITHTVNTHQRKLMGGNSIQIQMVTWAMARVLRALLDITPSDIRMKMEADLIMLCCNPYPEDKETIN